MPSSLLLTAFEPFDGRASNASVRVLAPILAAPPEDVTARVLPVDFRALRRLVPSLLAEVEPMRWLLLGEAEGADHVRCERVAKNWVDPALTDNAGAHVKGRAVRGGPDAYFSSLDPERVCEHFRRHLFPAEISESAGAYACNFAFYLALHHARAEQAGIQVGFLHIPRHYRRMGRGIADLRSVVQDLALDLTGQAPVRRARG